MNIDEIIELLDSENEKNVENGIEMAKNIKCIDCFIMPICSKTGSNARLWENCARAISKCSDQKLELYISRLIEWTEDINWPGAYTIYKRLLHFENKKLLIEKIKHRINFLKNPNESLMYIEWLSSFEKEVEKTIINKE